MLFRIVAVLILLLVTASAIDIIVAQRRRSHDAFDVKSVIKNRRRRLFAKVVFWTSSSAFLFHITGYFTPVEILVALVFGLIIPCSAILVSSLLLAENSDRELSIVARDPRTGEELGCVVGRIKEPDSDRVAAYKVRTSEGNVIEKPIDSVTVEIQ